MAGDCLVSFYKLQSDVPGKGAMQLNVDVCVWDIHICTTMHMTNNSYFN